MIRSQIVAFEKRKAEMKKQSEANDAKRLDIVDKMTTASLRRERLLLIGATVLGGIALIALILFFVMRG